MSVLIVIRNRRRTFYNRLWYAVLSDETPVKQGHRCTKEKAIEYLINEIREISNEIEKLICQLIAMKEALFFVHSVDGNRFLTVVLLIQQNEETG